MSSPYPQPGTLAQNCQQAQHTLGYYIQAGNIILYSMGPRPCRHQLKMPTLTAAKETAWASRPT